MNNHQGATTLIGMAGALKIACRITERKATNIPILTANKTSKNKSYAT